MRISRRGRIITVNLAQILAVYLGFPERAPENEIDHPQELLRDADPPGKQVNHRQTGQSPANTEKMFPSILPAADRKTPSRWLWPLLVLILCLGSIGNVQAGCSGSDVEPTRWADSKAPVAGQLTLALYVRYEHGTLSFTLERPIQPCHGPSCRTKSTMEPTILPLGGSRIVPAQADISWLQWDPQDPSQARLAPCFSQYAPRGGLDVQEPPPRATL